MSRILAALSLVFVSTAAFAQTLPDITTISPVSGLQGATVSLNVTGANLTSGFQLVPAAGIFPLSARVISNTSVVVTVVLLGGPGKYSVKVRTSAGLSDSSQTFTVMSSPLNSASEFDVASYLGPDGGAGSTDGNFSEGRFSGPIGVWSDGTYTYVADSFNGTIRRVTISSNQTTTLAGTAGNFGDFDGIGRAARFGVTTGLWGDGKYLYVTDLSNLTVRAFDLSSGRVTTIAGSSATAAIVDGVGTAARFIGPTGIWGDGTNLYVADSFSASNRAIRKIVLATGAVTTVADLGKLTTNNVATFPVGLWGDATNLYISDSGRHIIRKMAFSTGQITTLSGLDSVPGASEGSANGATFRYPSAIWGDGTDLFVSDTRNYSIRRVSIATGQTTLLAGAPGSPNAADGPAATARFGSPIGIAGTPSGTLFVTELTNHDVRQVTIATGFVTTLAGRPSRPGTADGYADTAQFYNPFGISGDSNSLYIGDFYGSTVRKVDLASTVSSTVAGHPLYPAHLDGIGLNAYFAFPAGVWADGAFVYITDPGFDEIRRINLSSLLVTSFAGSYTADPGFADGVGINAFFNYPLGIWGDGTNLYVADSVNAVVRKIVIATRTVTTFAGSPKAQGAVDGIGAAARFYNPTGLWGDGTNLYVLDGSGIRKVVLATGQVTTFAGSVVVPGKDDGQRLDAKFNNPNGIWGNGTNLYIADSGNNLIRKINLPTSTVSTIAGLVPGSENGRGSAGRFNYPTGIWGDGNALFVVDSLNNRVRRIAPVVPPDPRTVTNPGDITYQIADRGGLSRSTSGASTTTRVGYARVLPTGNNTTPSGMAIFGSIQNGALVSEAAVPASPLIQSGRIYADINSPVNTGLAMANPNNEAATLSFYFTDSNGTNQLAGTMSIPANGQISAFLDQAPFVTGDVHSILANARTFTFTSSLPISAVALRLLINERSEFLLTTLPVTILDQAPASAQTVTFPHFTDGAGWKTQVILVNPTDTTITGNLQFFSQGTATTPGAPKTLTANGTTADTFPYTIPARSSFKVTTSGTSEGFSGTVKATATLGTTAPSGLVVFSFRPGTVTVSEAGVGVTPSASAFRMYAAAAGNFAGGEIGSVQTGFAISNPSSANVKVNFELTTLDGVSTGLTGSTTVPATGQVAMFLNQIQGFEALPVPFQGVLRITGASVAVTGLRGRYNERREFLVTTTAPVDEASPLSTEELLFPQIADGGGYTTQFILFSGRTGQSPNGLLRFFSPSGGALGIVVQ